MAQLFYMGATGARIRWPPKIKYSTTKPYVTIGHRRLCHRTLKRWKVDSFFDTGKADEPKRATVLIPLILLIRRAKTVLQHFRLGFQKISRIDR